MYYGDHHLIPVLALNPPPKIYHFKRQSLKTLLPLSIVGVQLSQCQWATTRRNLNFYQEITKGSWYSFDQPRKDEKLSCPWNRPIVLNCSKRYLYGRFIQKVPLNFRPKKDILKINLYAVLNLCGLHFL